MGRIRVNLQRSNLTSEEHDGLGIVEILDFIPPGQSKTSFRTFPSDIIDFLWVRYCFAETVTAYCQTPQVGR